MAAASNSSINAAPRPAEGDARGFEDIALPIETEAPRNATTSTSPVFPSTAETQITKLMIPTTPKPDVGLVSTGPTESPEQDKTVAIALVVAILVVIIVLTVAYVLYQKRRQLCARRERGKAKPDLSANEALITPVKTNGGAETAPTQQQQQPQQPTKAAGLVSGPRDGRSRQHVPRKWYDSAAMKYMDQSTDTLDRV